MGDKRCNLPIPSDSTHLCEVWTTLQDCYCRNTVTLVKNTFFSCWEYRAIFCGKFTGLLAIICCCVAKVFQFPYLWLWCIAVEQASGLFSSLKWGEGISLCSCSHNQPNTYTEEFWQLQIFNLLPQARQIISSDAYYSPVEVVFSLCQRLRETFFPNYNVFQVIIFRQYAAWYVYFANIRIK